MQHSRWWWSSAILSLILILILLAQWHQMNIYEVKPPQLIEEAAVDRYLKNNWDDQSVQNSHPIPLVKIKTGIFIQSLQFFNSTEVSLTGYVWQHYVDGLHDAFKPEHNEIGFIFPEQVNSGADIKPKQAYRIKQKDGEVIGWYFEATLRQPFDYKNYPFDHKTIWVRMWPKDFSRNIVLVPDFNSYDATSVNDVFGIEENIVLGTWEREDTYFDYKLTSYDSNFGIDEYIGKTGFPELHYNLVVKRKFENAFIIHLLPLFLVAALLFSSLLTVSNKEEFFTKLGFNTSGFIGACSALFFVVLLAHIQLRRKFAEISIVYIEYFYILMYVFLILATINTYLFSIHSGRKNNLITHNDNMLPKVAYWPVLIGSMIIITLAFL